jgi:hypothetical protein
VHVCVHRLDAVVDIWTLKTWAVSGVQDGKFDLNVVIVHCLFDYLSVLCLHTV